MSNGPTCRLAPPLPGWLLHRRQVLGDRRRSFAWGGSVIDSVVGAFLTQNVSDFLSSKAFMELASRCAGSSRGTPLKGWRQGGRACGAGALAGAVTLRAAGAGGKGAVGQPNLPRVCENPDFLFTCSSPSRCVTLQPVAHLENNPARLPSPPLPPRAGSL